MKKIKELIALGLIQLVFVFVVLAISFDLFMVGVHFTNPSLEIKIANEIAWKIDGTFANDPNNIWYKEKK